jgi:nitrate reductase gamma subunit
MNIASLACSSLFYGMFVVLSVTSMYLLVTRYIAAHKTRANSTDRSIFRSTVFIAATCLFLAVTAVSGDVRFNFAF